MAEPTVDTVRLQDWVARIRDGDLVAREELLRAVCGRLERLARAMIHRYPSVRRWEETADVLQNSALRLMRALQDVTPTSTRDFFGLAAQQMRRVLLDLAKHYNGPRGHGANLAPVPPDSAAEPAAPGDDGTDLDTWQVFHESVEALPAEEREVVGLVFYHGWTQQQIAELFGIDERTVRRRWNAAQARLRLNLGEGRAESDAVGA